jgi:hypothetical protein
MSEVSRIKVLERRLDHLARRVAERRALGTLREDTDWDKSEMLALRWAIEKLTPFVSNDRME